MRTMIRLTALLLVAALIATSLAARWSPTTVQAQQGETVSETVLLPEFSAVHIRGAGQAIIQTGDNPSVSITAGERLIGHIDTTVEDGTLTIDFPSSALLDLVGLADISYVITAPSLNAIMLDGTVQALVNGLNATQLDIQLRAAAQLDLSRLQAQTLTGRIDLASQARIDGEVDLQQIEVVNASRYDASELQSVHAIMDVRDLSTATVRASRTLTGSADWGGTIEYIGTDTIVDVQTSRFGRVEQLPFVPLPALA
jgi:hypothetical protein